MIVSHLPDNSNTQALDDGYYRLLYAIEAQEAKDRRRAKRQRKRTHPGSRCHRCRAFHPWFRPCGEGV